MLIYLDTLSGIAGDMLLAALVDAGADRDYILRQLRSLSGLEQVDVQFSETQRHCFRALRIDVHHPPEHQHRHLRDIEAMIESSRLTAREREMSLRIFRRLGAAEAKVHGTSVEEVHFHEVGAIDSIVDIVGIAVALCNLQVTQIRASATPTGCGTIHIAHGLVSVPAPATAELLCGVPIRSSNVEAELTTPTGAAVLATLVDGFGPLPDMQIARIGYGAGHKELSEQANVLRVLVGTSLSNERDDVLVLETNLDTLSGEQLGFAIEQLWLEQPLDVFTTAIGMKKNRPACLLSVICRPQQREKIESCIFHHTGSLGVRCTRMSRHKLNREILTVDVAGGSARVKIAWSSQVPASPRVAPEYEDCRRLALQSGQSLQEIFQLVSDAARRNLKDRLGQLSPANVAHDHHHDHDHAHHDHDHAHHDHDHAHHDHDHDHHDHHSR